MLDKKKAAISRGVVCFLGDKCRSMLKRDGSLVDYVVRQIIEHGGLRSDLVLEMEATNRATYIDKPVDAT